MKRTVSVFFLFLLPDFVAASTYLIDERIAFVVAGMDDRMAVIYASSHPCTGAAQQCEYDIQCYKRRF